MTTQEIEELFYNVIEEDDFKKRSKLSKQVVYNYRHRQNPKIGTMLEILLTLRVIKITLK